MNIKGQIERLNEAHDAKLKELVNAKRRRDIQHRVVVVSVISIIILHIVLISGALFTGCGNKTMVNPIVQPPITELTNDEKLTFDPYERTEIAAYAGQQFPAQIYYLAALACIVGGIVVSVFTQKPIIAVAGGLSAGLLITVSLLAVRHPSLVEAGGALCFLPVAIAASWYAIKAARASRVMANAIETTQATEVKAEIQADKKDAAIVESVVRPLIN